VCYITRNRSVVQVMLRWAGLLRPRCAEGGVTVPACPCTLPGMRPSYMSGHVDAVVCELPLLSLWSRQSETPRHSAYQKVAQQMRSTHLLPPGRIPRIGTPAVRRQDTAEPFPQQLLRDLSPTRQADREDSDPGGHRDPQPGARVPFAPSRLVQVCNGLRTDLGLGFGHWCRHGLHGRLLQMWNRP
jgi:hypothetical protein